MRELTLRIEFTTPCLGSIRTYKTVSVRDTIKKRSYYLLPRSPDGRIIFNQKWWSSILRKAADVDCSHQKHVDDVRFELEVDGMPRKIPENFYERYYQKRKFAPHEAFFAGDVIGVSCLVPGSISDDDLWRLMDLAGKYYGISPLNEREYGLFKVVGLQRRGRQVPRRAAPQRETAVAAREVTAE